MIEWIYQASIQSLNREQVPQATKTIVQDCANQWLSSVAEYRLRHLYETTESITKLKKSNCVRIWRLSLD